LCSSRSLTLRTCSSSIKNKFYHQRANGPANQQPSGTSTSAAIELHYEAAEKERQKHKSNTKTKILKDLQNCCDFSIAAGFHDTQNLRIIGYLVTGEREGAAEEARGLTQPLSLSLSLSLSLC